MIQYQDDDIYLPPQIINSSASGLRSGNFVFPRLLQVGAQSNVKHSMLYIWIWRYGDGISLSESRDLLTKVELSRSGGFDSHHQVRGYLDEDQGSLPDQILYRVILKKVSFGIFSIILIFKEEKNFIIQSKDKVLSLSKFSYLVIVKIIKVKH